MLKQYGVGDGFFDGTIMDPKKRYKALHRLHRILFKDYLPLLAADKIDLCKFVLFLKLPGSCADPCMIPESIGIKVTTETSQIYKNRGRL